MEKLLILGAGQYAMVVREIAQATGGYEQIDFLDDRSPLALGKLEELAAFAPSYTCGIVAMGNPALRANWMARLAEAGLQIPVLVHPKAYVSPSAVLGQGCVVEPMAVVQTGAQVGDGCLLCAGSVVNHNAFVNAVCQIDCCAVVPANAQVPEGTKVPCGSVFTGN